MGLWEVDQGERAVDTGLFILEVSKSSIYKRGEKETPKTGLEGTLEVLLQTQSLPTSVLGVSSSTYEAF